MYELLDAPQKYVVTLVSGAVVKVWAETVSDLDPKYADRPILFCVSMRVPYDEQPNFPIREGWGSPNDLEVQDVIVAEFDRDTVDNIDGDSSWR
jgi:hypothetical protein